MNYGLKLKCDNRSFWAIINCCNLGPLLDYLGYKKFLSKVDIKHIRNTIFASDCLTNNHDIFGLMKKSAPSYYDHILSILHKSNIHLNAFKPHKEEEKIKRLKVEKELSHKTVSK